MTKNNIVIDIETLGRRNDAAITQIGVVIADETFSVLDKYLIQIFPEAWNTCNRTGKKGIQGSTHTGFLLNNLSFVVITQNHVSNPCLLS